MFVLNIDLSLPIEGYYTFISSWLIKTNKQTILLDPGPTASIPILIKELKNNNIKKLDVVLLTHIHLDHAGGLGALVENFSVDKVFCFGKAIKHLVDPQKLWEASKANLKEFALVQGEPKAVPKNIIFDAKDKIALGNLEIKVIETPGHAPHHISFLIEDHLFIGEALGVIVDQNKNYLRPATPPKFVKDIYVNSINKLAKINAKYLCFGHFGKIENSKDFFNKSLTQINLWIDLIKEYRVKDNFNDLDIINSLIEKDIIFSEYKNLPEDIKKRESRFIKNSIKGIYQSLN